MLLYSYFHIYVYLLLSVKELAEDTKKDGVLWWICLVLVTTEQPNEDV